MELKLKNKAMEQLEGMLLIVLNGIETGKHRQRSSNQYTFIVLNGIETQEQPYHARLSESFNRTKWNFWDVGVVVHDSFSFF